jgi:hypothetical protein
MTLIVLVMTCKFRIILTIQLLFPDQFGVWSLFAISFSARFQALGTAKHPVLSRIAISNCRGCPHTTLIQIPSQGSRELER